MVSLLRILKPKPRNIFVHLYLNRENIWLIIAFSLHTDASVPHVFEKQLGIRNLSLKKGQCTIAAFLERGRIAHWS